MVILMGKGSIEAKYGLIGLKVLKQYIYIYSCNVSDIAASDDKVCSVIQSSDQPNSYTPRRFYLVL